jgi:hypothetical protein
MLEMTGLASAQPVLHRDAAPNAAEAGFRGAGCRIGRQRPTGLLFEDYDISINDARSGVVEADHSK